MSCNKNIVDGCQTERAMRAAEVSYGNTVVAGNVHEDNTQQSKIAGNFRYIYMYFRILEMLKDRTKYLLI